LFDLLYKASIHYKASVCKENTAQELGLTPVPRAEFKTTTTVYEQDGAAQPLTSLRRNVTYNNKMNNFTSMAI